MEKIAIKGGFFHSKNNSFGGDFHPKNIFIGHDDPNDPKTAYAAVIDFNSSIRLPRAFDARTCLSMLYYLHKVGMGESENFWKVRIESERSINRVSVH